MRSSSSQVEDSELGSKSTFLAYIISCQGLLLHHLHAQNGWGLNQKGEGMPTILSHPTETCKHS